MMLQHSVMFPVSETNLRKELQLSPTKSVYVYMFCMLVTYIYIYTCREREIRLD